MTIKLIRCRSHLVAQHPQEWETIAEFSDAATAIRELRTISHFHRASGDSYALTINEIPQEIIDDSTLGPYYDTCTAGWSQ